MRLASTQYSIWKKYYLFKRYGLNNLGDESIHAFVVGRRLENIDNIIFLNYSIVQILKERKTEMDLSETTNEVVNRHLWELSRTKCTLNEFAKYLGDVNGAAAYVNIGAEDLYFDRALLKR